MIRYATGPHIQLISQKRVTMSHRMLFPSTRRRFRRWRGFGNFGHFAGSVSWMCGRSFARRVRWVSRRRGSVSFHHVSLVSQCCLISSANFFGLFMNSCENVWFTFLRCFAVCTAWRPCSVHTGATWSTTDRSSWQRKSRHKFSIQQEVL